MAHNPAVLANASVHGTVSRDPFEDFLALRGGGQLLGDDAFRNMRIQGWSGDPGDGPFAAAQATLRTAGIGAAVGGVVGARLGWAARGWAQAASSAKDGVSGALGKAKDAVSGKA